MIIRRSLLMRMNPIRVFLPIFDEYDFHGSHLIVKKSLQFFMQLTNFCCGFSAIKLNWSLGKWMKAKVINRNGTIRIKCMVVLCTNMLIWSNANAMPSINMAFIHLNIDQQTIRTVVTGQYSIADLTENNYPFFIRNSMDLSCISYRRIYKMVEIVNSILFRTFEGTTPFYKIHWK